MKKRSSSPLNPIRWIGEGRSASGVTFRIGRRGEEIFAEFVGAGTLRADRRGAWARFTPHPQADPRHVIKLESGLVRALVWHLRSELALHASAAERGGMAVACFGASGAGKSTAMAELCSRPQFALLADDALVLKTAVEGIDVIPGETTHWLLPSARGALGLGASFNQAGKAGVPARALANAPARLVAACNLVFDEAARGPELVRLRGQEMLASLAAAAIRFVIDEPERQLREFEQLETFSRCVAVYELRRPRNLKMLHDVGDVLASLV